MKIYILTSYTGCAVGCDEAIGVYSSMEKAQIVKEKRNRGRDEKIEIFELDEDPDETKYP